MIIDKTSFNYKGKYKIKRTILAISESYKETFIFENLFDHFHTEAIKIKSYRYKYIQYCIFSLGDILKLNKY